MTPEATSSGEEDSDSEGSLGQLPLTFRLLTRVMQDSDLILKGFFYDISGHDLKEAFQHFFKII